MDLVSNARASRHHPTYGFLAIVVVVGVTKKCLAVEVFMNAGSIIKGSTAVLQRAIPSQMLDSILKQIQGESMTAFTKKGFY